MACGAEVKIKMPLEKALFCPKHGRQIYYTSCLGSKGKWCDRDDVGENKGGGVIAFVSKKGKITYTGKRLPKSIWDTQEPVVYSQCFRALSERMVMPKFEKLLGRTWKYEWGSKIWAGVPNRKHRVSQNGPGKTWHIYYPQYNTKEYKEMPVNKQPKVWRGRYTSRIRAMKAAVENCTRCCVGKAYTAGFYDTKTITVARGK